MRREHKMDHLVQSHHNSHHQHPAEMAVNFATAAVLTRRAYGRVIPGPFAQFGSPITPYSIPSLAHHYGFHPFHPSSTGYLLESMLHAGATTDTSTTSASPSASANLISSLATSALNNHATNHSSASNRNKDSLDSLRNLSTKKGMVS